MIDELLLPRSRFKLKLLTFKQVFPTNCVRYNTNMLFYLSFKKLNLIHIYNVEIYAKMFTLRYYNHCNVL